MRDLQTCALALTWVLVVIRQMGTRRYPRETADHIDRDFREMVDVARAHRRLARCDCGVPLSRGGGGGHGFLLSCACCRHTCFGTGRIHIDGTGQRTCDCPAQSRVAVETR